MEDFTEWLRRCLVASHFPVVDPLLQHHAGAEWVPFPSPQRPQANTQHFVFMPSSNICASPHLSIDRYIDNGLARRSLCFSKLRALFLLVMELILRETSQCLAFRIFNICRSSCFLVLAQRNSGEDRGRKTWSTSSGRSVPRIGQFGDSWNIS